MSLGKAMVKDLGFSIRAYENVFPARKVLILHSVRRSTVQDITILHKIRNIQCLWTNFEWNFQVNRWPNIQGTTELWRQIVKQQISVDYEKANRKISIQIWQGNIFCYTLITNYSCFIFLPGTKETSYLQN